MFPNFSGYTALKKVTSTIGQQFRQIILKCMEESETSSQSNNYLTAYIAKMRSCEDSTSGFYKERTSKDKEFKTFLN